MINLGDRLVATRFRPAGFDYLRLALALSVVFYHSVTVAYGDAQTKILLAWHLPIIPHIFSIGAYPVVAFIVPSFFALSGFLVAGSLERNSVPSFFALRAIRIFPALSVEVLVSAFILGPLVTSVPLNEYFTDPKFHAYFLNIVGDIHYELPGVFETLPPPHYVNAQLWTVPFELYCYLSLALFSLVGLVKRPRLMAGVAIFLASAFTIYVLNGYGAKGLIFGGPPFVFSFLFGVVINLMRTRIPFSGWLAIISLGASWFCLEHAKLIFLGSLPIAYLTIWIGLQDPPRSILTERADYSYGIYLYSYPVQQTLAFLFASAHLWHINLLLSVLISGFVAYLSWTFVESPILAKKREVVTFIDKIGGRVKRQVYS